MTQDLCADQDLQALIAMIQSDEAGALRRVEGLLADFPRDARLHFLYGSMLISAGKHIEAYAALNRAVDIAPDFAIARFQLGFFQLTSGEPNNAIATWQPLDALEEGNYLRLFAQGLRSLIRDEFDTAIEYLQQGMQANEENPPLNRDMQLLIDECRKKDLLPANQDAPVAAATDEKEEVSATSFILGQFLGRGKRRDR